MRFCSCRGRIKRRLLELRSVVVVQFQKIYVSQDKRQNVKPRYKETT
jgi:hypothetical protein